MWLKCPDVYKYFWGYCKCCNNNLLLLFIYNQHKGYVRCNFWICRVKIFFLGWLVCFWSTSLLTVKRLARVCLTLSWDPWTACSVKHIKDPRNKSNLPSPHKPSAGHYSGIDCTRLSLRSDTRVWKSHEINTDSIHVPLNKSSVTLF